MTDAASTILAADADGPTRSFLADQLTADGYHVLTARPARRGPARAVRGGVRFVLFGEFERLASRSRCSARSAPAMAATAGPIPPCRSSWSAAMAASRRRPAASRWCRSSGGLPYTDDQGVHQLVGRT